MPGGLPGGGGGWAVLELTGALCMANLLLYVYLATSGLVSSKGCDKMYTGVLQ